MKACRCVTRALHQFPQSRLGAGVERCEHCAIDARPRAHAAPREIVVAAVLGGFSHRGSSPAQAACSSAVRVSVVTGVGLEAGATDRTASAAAGMPLSGMPIVAQGPRCVELSRSCGSPSSAVGSAECRGEAGLGLGGVAGR